VKELSEALAIAKSSVDLHWFEDPKSKEKGGEANHHHNEDEEEEAIHG